jgi:hypothetical protein
VLHNLPCCPIFRQKKAAQTVDARVAHASHQKYKATNITQNYTASQQSSQNRSAK